MAEISKKEKIIDFISGREIYATPEEINSVQPMSRELVGIFNYNKDDIITRPQFHVGIPSNGTKYPIDIAVFENQKLKIIVECKKNESKEGINQLKKYMELSEAMYGIWFNGVERKYFKKVILEGLIHFKEINSIPVKGISNNEALRKNQLKEYDDLKSIFREIHSYVSAHIVGSTTGFNIAENLIRVLFCKIWDERYKESGEFLEFFAFDDENPANVSDKIKKIFNKVKIQYSSVFDKNEEIDFSDDLVFYIVNRIKYISLMNSQRDAIADAFEVFVGTALKGEHGQFFTPRNIIRFLLKYIDKNFKNISSKMKIMDPACGTGGFIVEGLDYIWKKIDNSDKNISEKTAEKINFAQSKVFGFDKDMFVSKVTKAYMCIMGDGTSNVENLDSLISLANHYDSVDLLLTNPPFGKKIKIKDESVLKNYNLKTNGKNGVNPEILFVELAIKLLKDNGIMAIVVPEGIVGNPSHEYFKLREFLVNNGKILSIISLPTETFKPHTGIKSSIIIFEKTKDKKVYETIFIDVKKIGHDKNGKILYKIDNFGQPIKDKEDFFIIDDELNDFLKIDLNELRNFNSEHFNSKYFKVSSKIILDNKLKLFPSYYSEFINSLSKPEDKDKKFFTIEELIKENILESTSSGLLLTGKDVGSKNYSDEGVPFLRTSDIKNLEIVRNPQKFVNKNFYDNYAKKLKIYDIIFAKDGKHCVGESAVIMPGEEEALLQSHMYIFRTINGNKLKIDQFNLIAELNSDYFIEQVKKSIFHQGTIPTISDSIYKIKISFYKDDSKLLEQSNKYKKILEERYELKKLIITKW